MIGKISQHLYAAASIQVSELDDFETLCTTTQLFANIINNSVHVLQCTNNFTASCSHKTPQAASGVHLTFHRLQFYYAYVIL